MTGISTLLPFEFLSSFCGTFWSLPLRLVLRKSFVLTSTCYRHWYFHVLARVDKSLRNSSHALCLHKFKICKSYKTSYQVAKSSLVQLSLHIGGPHAATLLRIVPIIIFLILNYITMPHSLHRWRCSVLIWSSPVFEAFDTNICDNMLYNFRCAC
jgi:hypothetical protein